MSLGFLDLMVVAGFILVLPLVAGGIAAVFAWPRDAARAQARPAEEADRAA